MNSMTLHTRLMLQQYELQMLTARRLARYRRARLLETEEQPPDPDLHRKKTVHRIAQELYAILLSVGSENPMVEVITQRLGEELGSKVRLTYPAPAPLHDAQVCFVREFDNKQAPAKALDAEEHKVALQRLWHITLRTVDESTI